MKGEQPDPDRTPDAGSGVARATSGPARCGSKRKNGRPPCRNVAGFRTDHPGMGRCFLHGGNIPAGPENANWRHGLYAKVFRGKLAERLKQAMQGPDPLHLSGEVAAARAVVVNYVEQVQTEAGLTGEQAGVVLAMLGQIGTLVSKDMDVRTIRHSPEVEILFVQNAMERAIRDFIPDPERQRAFVARIRAAFPGQLELGRRSRRRPGTSPCRTGGRGGRAMTATRTDDAIRMGDATTEAFTDCVELMVRLKQRLEQEDPEGYQAIVEWGWMATPQLATEAAETLWLVGTWGAMSAQQKQEFESEYPDAYKMVEELARAVQRKTEGRKLKIGEEQ